MATATTRTVTAAATVQPRRPRARTSAPGYTLWSHRKRRGSFSETLFEEERRQNGHQRQCAGEREAEHEDEGGRHRAEHLSLDAAQAQDRQEHDGDDPDREDHRAGDLVGRGPHLLEERLGFVTSFVEAPEHVLDEDHRSVDHEPEVDRAEAHQVARRSRTSASG